MVSAVVKHCLIPLLQAGLLLRLPAALATRVEFTWIYANPRFVRDSAADEQAEALDYTHMGMLAILPNNELVAAWQGATVFWEGSSMQGLYLARSPDFGQTWHKEELLVPPEANLPIWAPVLHVQENRVWLFYSESRSQCWWAGEGGMHWAPGGDLKAIFSEDNAKSWSSPQVVQSFDAEGGIAKMISNKPAVSQDGRWLLPFWREMGGHDCIHAPGMHGKAGVLITEDQGDSWSTANVALDEASSPTWLIEGTISGFKRKTGSEEGNEGDNELAAKETEAFLQLFRTQAGTIYAATSEDGSQWDSAKPTELPNPNSKVDSLTLPDGGILVAFNDDPHMRSNLTLASTSDGGQSWQRHLVLEDDPQGAFAYPSLQYLPGTDEVLVIYSVAYPPSRRPVGEPAMCHQKPASHRSLWSRLTAWWRLLGSLAPRKVCTLGDKSLKDQPVNAWGLDSYGLRLATVSASELTGIVQES